MGPAAIKDLYERIARVIARRPLFARASGQASLRVLEGLACEVSLEEGGFRVDLPVQDGGTAGGPSPAELMRASLGACLALGYKIWAARLDVPIERIELEVGSEHDARGPLGLDPGVPARWQRVVLAVTITSAAPEADVRRVVDTANRLSPMLANLSGDVERVHRLVVLRPGARRLATGG
jgi:uncharacterized OsmC-like protein